MTLTYSSKCYDIFIEIDVDEKSFSLAVKDHNNMQRSKKMPSNPEHFYNYLQNNYRDKKAIYAYEVYGIFVTQFI